MKDKSEIKIFILHLMDRIGYPVNCNDVCSILSQESIAGYFECGDCFTELVEAGHLIDSGLPDDKGETTYVVTDSGKQIESALSDQISSSIKEASYRSAIRYLSFEKRGAIVNCHKTRLESGKYSVHCEIVEKGRRVLEINIDVDTEREADTMLFNFRRRPEVVFQGTMALVSGEKNYIFEK
ncbi:MAG: DUF4364 family protein [Clostridia bacterium]|nr:DUF4364 family protein [Clostridia bacterium]